MIFRMIFSCINPLLTFHSFLNKRAGFELPSPLAKNKRKGRDCKPTTRQGDKLKDGCSRCAMGRAYS